MNTSAPPAATRLTQELQQTAKVAVPAAWRRRGIQRAPAAGADNCEFSSPKSLPRILGLDRLEREWEADMDEVQPDVTMQCYSSLTSSASTRSFIKWYCIRMMSPWYTVI